MSTTTYELIFVQKTLIKNVSFGKNVIIFESDMNLSVHNDYKNKDILILRERLT